jgi:hypothetical protein
VRHAIDPNIVLVRPAHSAVSLHLVRFRLAEAIRLAAAERVLSFARLGMNPSPPGDFSLGIDGWGRVTARLGAEPGSTLVHRDDPAGVSRLLALEPAALDGAIRVHLRRAHLPFLPGWALDAVQRTALHNAPDQDPGSPAADGTAVRFIPLAEAVIVELCIPAPDRAPVHLVVDWPAGRLDLEEAWSARTTLPPSALADVMLDAVGRIAGGTPTV